MCWALRHAKSHIFLLGNIQRKKFKKMLSVRFFKLFLRKQEKAIRQTLFMSVLVIHQRIWRQTWITFRDGYNNGLVYKVCCPMLLFAPAIKIFQVRILLVVCFFVSAFIPNMKNLLDQLGENKWVLNHKVTEVVHMT